MDAETCIINLCSPRLESDMPSLLARLTRIEDQLSTGSFATAPVAPAAKTDAVAQTQKIADKPASIVNEPEESEPIKDQAPAGFWNDVASDVRKELNPALSGFFATSPNAPLRGVLNADKLTLICTNKYIVDIVNKPDVVELVARKASAKLGRLIRVVVTDQTSTNEKNQQLEQLIQFGRAHSDVINIKN